jgi:hypothetical protein
MRYEQFDGLADERAAFVTEHSTRLKVRIEDPAVSGALGDDKHGVRQQL